MDKEDMRSIRKYFISLNTTQRIILLFVIFNFLLYAFSRGTFYASSYQKIMTFGEYYYRDITIILIIVSVLAFFLFSDKNKAEK